MYVAKDLPLPNDQNFPQEISKKIIEILRVSSGKALVLFTSYYNMNMTYQAIKNNIPYTVLKQGDMPKLSLLEKFKTDTEDAEKLVSIGEYEKSNADTAETAALMMVAQVLYNLDETITKE